MQPQSTQVEIRTTGVEGPLKLRVVAAGPPDGTPVVLLHGFPESSYGWRHQVPALAAAGYRVLAPDQRGYAGSDKPRDVAAYRLEHLVDDVVGLLDALCDGAPAHVVGHDWGGAVAWHLAMHRPDRVRTLTVANCPRPRVLRHALWTDPRQLARSWYMLFFQLPGVPERKLSGGAVARMLRRTSAPGTFTDEDLRRYQDDATPEAMRGALNWYRAGLRHPAPERPIHVPTLLLWGTADVALGEALAAPSIRGIEDARLIRLEGASHWVLSERPAEVNAHLLGFLQEHGGPDPLVYKVVDGRTWADAPDPWPGAEVDHRDGFVHLSARHQVAETLARHFRGRRDLRLLGVDPARLPPGRLRWEVSRGGARFPHLYAPLPRRAVVTSWALDLGDDDVPVLPDELADVQRASA